MEVEVGVDEEVVGGEEALGVGVVDVCACGGVDGVLVEADVVDAAATFGADACDVWFGGVGEGDNGGEGSGRLWASWRRLWGRGAGALWGLRLWRCEVSMVVWRSPARMT